jgi:hypothetical protein
MTSTHCLSRKLRNSLAAGFIAFSGVFLFPSIAKADDVAAEVTTIVTPGGDDVSYQIPLTVSVVYDGVTYENVYATTNSVITFGRPDGTYWTYPSTPSVSIESKDWWVLPQQMPDTHFIINVSEGGFQVDGNYRPYGTFTGNTTSIIITAQIQTDGTVAYSYAVDGPLSGNERTGAVLTDGTVVPLEEVNIIEVDEAPVLEPIPVNPTPEPEVVPVEPEPVLPEPEVVPVPEPEPAPQPRPEPQPVYEPLPVEPEPVPEEVIPEELPEELPVEETPLPTPEPEPEPEPEPLEPEVPEEVLPVEPEPVVESHEESVTLDNGVVLTAQQAVAVALLENPAELLQELFTNPAAAFAALAQVGADMSPEVRERSEEVVVAAVIVGNIASAASAAAYRRKP